MQSNPRISVNLLVILIKTPVNLLVKLTKSGQGGVPSGPSGLGTTLLGLPLPTSLPSGTATTPTGLLPRLQEEPLADYRNPLLGGIHSREARVWGVRYSPPYSLG
jgi:hypothetical protein